MKKIILLFVCCTAVLYAYATNNTTITGKLTDLRDGATLTLIPTGTHLQEDPVATAKVTNGEFKLETSLEEARTFLIVEGRIEMGRLMRIMIAPNDKMSITGTFSNPVIAGSEIHNEFVEKFINPRAAMDRRYAEIQEKHAEVNKRLSEVHGSAAALAELKASEEWKAYEKDDAGFFRYVSETIDKEIEKNAATFWGPLVLMAHTTFLTPDMVRYYNMFSDEAKNSFYGKAAAAGIFGIPAGQLAPAFTAKDADGNEHSLQSLLKGNNYVLVDFWATWCAPCRRFIPTLKELAAKYEDDGLVVVAISTDKDRNAWVNFLEKEPKPWLNVLDESGISKDYGVSGIPSIFLIDPQGKMVFGKLSGNDVVTQLAEVFGK
jgi:thiol-disulfide isomerase/thioredoxin